MFSTNSAQWILPASEEVDVSTAFSGGRLQVRDPLICNLDYLGLVFAYAGLEATLILVDPIAYDN